MPERPKIIDTIATVERNDLITTASSRSYGLLRLQLDQQITVLPGQFAMLKPRGHYEPLLRRAMAYYRRSIAGGLLKVDFIYQIVGRGTRMLAKLKIGDEVDFLGSLGNTFDLETARGREALLVAGGVGSAALLMLAEELLEREVPVRLFIGGASRADLCGIEDFTALLSSQKITSATIDGSHGERGFVTPSLERYLQSEMTKMAEVAEMAEAGRPKVIYACGPDPMLHRVSQIADQFAIPAQLSLESPMACGFGICVGCAVPIKTEVTPGCPEGFAYKKVCTDGPVFWSHDLHW